MSFYLTRIYSTYGSYEGYLQRLNDMEERRTWLSYGGSHIDPMPAAESFYAAINMFASVVCPADPNTDGTPPSPNDLAAGSLSSEVVFDGTTGARVASFAKQFLALVDEIAASRSAPLDSLPEINRHDVVSVFYELDWQATNSALLVANEASFRALTPADQATLVLAINAGTVVPGTIPGGTSSLLRVLQSSCVLIVNICAGLNYPEHRINLDSETGWTPPNGIATTPPGRPAFTDVANQITSPNVPGTGTFFDYTGSYYPLKAGVEARVKLAVLEAEAQAVESEAELTLLLADDAARTLVQEA